MRLRLLLFVILLSFSPLSHAADVVDLGQLPLNAETIDTSDQVIDLGQDVRRGVEARLQLEPLFLLDLSEPLEGDLQHFLVTVSFVENATGKTLVDGQVAARTFTPDNRTMATVRLEPQQHFWRATMGLPAEGETMIKVGSKLADGKKRIYRFFFDRRPILPPVIEVTPVDQ